MISCVCADFKEDLHNFAFLGKSARIGTASDWVWYNVPHGPQKQIESFIHGQKCIREGKEEVGNAGRELPLQSFLATIRLRLMFWRCFHDYDYLCTLKLII